MKYVFWLHISIYFQINNLRSNKFIDFHFEPNITDLYEKDRDGKNYCFCIFIIIKITSEVINWKKEKKE